MLFGTDRRLARTVRSLLLDAGDLPRRHLEGENGLLHPIRTYLLINFVFFLLVPLVNTEQGTVWNITGPIVTEMPPDTTPLLMREQRRRAAEANGPSEVVFQALFDERVRSLQGAFVFSMIPLLALVLYLCLFRVRPYLADHLLFATSLLTWYLLILLLFGLVVRLVMLAIPEGAEFGAAMRLISLFFVLAMVGIWRAVRTFYGLGWFKACLLAPVAMAAFLAATMLYGKGLFFYALWSL
jgi:hypothetical protein